MKPSLIEIMAAAGYTYDDLESTDDCLRFFYDYGVMTFNSWKECEEWLNGVVFDDPILARLVGELLLMRRSKTNR